jgi:Fe-S-cluster-containing dehydrogenase component
VVRLGLHADETSQFANWNVPAAHFLESWGDGRTSDDTYVSIQPMILPLYGGWSELDLLARLAGRPKPEGPELVQETFQKIASPGNFAEEWNRFLHDGFSSAAPQPPAAATFDSAAAAGFVREESQIPMIAGEDAYEVVFTSSASVEDGRYASNSWLQEIPDPVTKLTWDNAALISPATAAKLGVRNAVNNEGATVVDVIRIALDETRAIEAPALIVPGHADHSVSIPLGYGRTEVGWVGRGAGVNVYPLRTTAQPYFVVGATVAKTPRTYPLAITQNHNVMEGRALAREGTVDHYREQPDFAKKMGMDAHIPADVSLYKSPPLDAANQWGMAIDLSTCTGCNACMIACQAENNIPIVGKEQVIFGRDMHWIRVDRYFTSVNEADEDPQMVMQPLPCQHCENAPCETVCPVNATVHSNDGLNVMTYNRCIGTRYCANNCPFKVRRFNFFNYNERPIEAKKLGPFEVGGLYLGPLTEKGMPAIMKMQKNPNVTVRIRGVMEKCTFCVQRIQEAKIAQKVKAGASDDVRVPPDIFQVACQQVCPTGSIVFGDVNNPESKVAKLKAQPRNYRLLEYLNVRTRVSYLARIRNPNMKMPGAEKMFPAAGHAAGEH